ncbi:uncharacterized protein B0T15DRAFT_550595 [Chaetomium strumarium]|uniref:Phospholipid-transporting ATPase n=1 Tax=Chaetomium strumarium TaxID=1170767 RepID=A0AAJ0GYH2_9PEZI|nr:hypothetical protein B0T15DRAFT_550595 [Chaetomium strumarium]
MEGRSQRETVDALRDQLEHIELQNHSPSIPSDDYRTAQDPQSGELSPTPRWGVRFENGDDARPPGEPRRPQLARARTTADLYTIQSHTFVPPTRQLGQDRLDPSSSTGPHATGRIRIDEPRVSLTRPRQTIEELRENVKYVVAPDGKTADAQSLGSWISRRRKQQRRLARQPWEKARAIAERAYKRYIVEGLLRQKPIPPSQDGRHIPLKPGLARRKPLKDERTGHPYVSNVIRSSRYTIWNFLPKQMFFQFSKLANFYFLVIGILQMIPGLSTTGTYTTIGPLIAFVALSMAKEGYDDYRRYRLDKLENRSSAWVLDPERTVKEQTRSGGRRFPGLPIRKSEKAAADTEEQAQATGDEAIGTRDAESGHWARVQWQDLRVGDIIRLRRDDNVPADIVLLHATGPNGVAYIETMALDGETNLKSKQACPLLAKQCFPVESMGACVAEVVSEDPNMDLYNFEGRATVNGETMPLTLNEVVYRGSTLRNTAEAVGLVINSGEECKIRMNANKNVRAKAPEMQNIVNRIVIMLVFFVILLSLGCTVGYIVWRRQYERRAFYLQHGSVELGQIFIAFVIAYNTLIPLSLYVSHEIVKLGQLFLLRDIEMYDPVTDTPMVANTTTILENLGQVSYVFSDKTGTLTENMMKFRKMSVAGTAFLHDRDLQRESEKKGKKPMRRDTVERDEKVRDTSTAKISTRVTDLEMMEEDPLVEGRRSETRRLPRTNTGASRWKTSTHPAHGQPEAKTDDLIRYLTNKPHSHFSRRARQFILCLALCHTCLPETGEDGEIAFQAASPDELALVEAAKDLGYLLVDRAAQSMTLQVCHADGSTTRETYEIMDVVEFSSKRKRMSIVVRMPDGKLCIFTKGADSVILPRLRQKQLAIQTASAVERRASMRRSMEQERALRRQSLHSAKPRNSLNFSRRALDRKDSWHRSAAIAGEVDSWLTRRQSEAADEQLHDADPYCHTPRRSLAGARSLELAQIADPSDALVDESLVLNEAAVFERCFQHVDEFATEGLRTLIFAYRYLDEDEYRKWKAIYHQATTSLVKRQERIEDAAELIERDFDLAGATAIEDKLQQGVPETIDKLRRANVKVWMLTGDKRETAINVAHSARICKPFSEVYILDVTQGDLQERLSLTLTDVSRGMVPHSVAVIDGHTLSAVEDDDALRVLFFDLVARVDSVICCRASPSQKANLVKCIRRQIPSAVTLAIGDGANDIAMIQASHVGIGISGREGLQAARISDYSIAQFRFLQRLLFVHGRWLYVRSGKYILGTFWKEVVFYLVQAHYQLFNGYTGTSIFESTSLTVFNTIFTSLPVIIPGIFERDLSAETLLANKGFNFLQYLGWMLLAVVESVIIYYAVYYIYAVPTHWPVPTDLYPVGTLAFALAVVFINLKLMFLEVHDRTWVILGAMVLSLTGWWVWNVLLSALFKDSVGPYVIRDAFLGGFGRRGMWWLVFFAVLSALVVFELGVTAEMEAVKGVKEVLREHATAAAAGAGGTDDYDRDYGDGGEAVAAAGGGPAVVVAGDAGSLETVPCAAVPSPSHYVHGAAGGGGGRLTGEFARPPFTPPSEERIGKGA